MKIATIIVIFGDMANANEAVASLKGCKLEKMDHKIFLIDNTKMNRGFVGGNNKGIREAFEWGAHAVLLLNDDTKVDPAALQYLVRTLFSDSKIGMVVPKIYFYPGYEFHKNRYKKDDQGKVVWYAGGMIDWNNIAGVHIGVDEIDRGQYDIPSNVEFATGCCVLIRREVFEKIGYLDDRYFLYLEDLDFSVRAKRAGYRIVFNQNARVWHKNAQSSGSGSALHDYFFTRNRLLFGFDYAAERTKFALMRESVRMLFGGNTWKKKGVLDFYFRRFGRGSWT